MKLPRSSVVTRRFYADGSNGGFRVRGVPLATVVWHAMHNGRADTVRCYGLTRRNFRAIAEFVDKLFSAVEREQ